MIQLTPNASKAVKRLIRFSEAGLSGLRISVTAGGCAGLQYQIEMAEGAGPEDTVVDCDGIQVFLDAASAPMIKELTIDYVDNMVSSGFTFHNPNAAASCGCGKSFAV